MHKKNYVRDIKAGNILEKEPFVVRSVTEGKDIVTLSLSDNSGEIAATILPENTEMVRMIKEHISGVLAISGPVVPKAGCVLESEVKIRDVSICEDYIPRELFGGISEETKMRYIKGIKNLISKFTHPAYKALVEVCLTDEVLEKLAKLPATHSTYGLYLGGALASTFSVATMVHYGAVAYYQGRNGLYDNTPNTDLLVATALLYQVGKIEYYDEVEPFKKSRKGVILHYFPLLQSLIETKVREHELVFEGDDLLILLNALAVTGKSPSRSVSKEGAFVRNMIALYGESDCYDSFVANNMADLEGNYIYSDRDNRYYLVNNQNPCITAQ